jgi:serine phosphatase RsbU (regulator of sigma subunit)
MTQAPVQADGQHDEVTTLQCMEIWGGNHAARRGIALSGLLAHIDSEPHDGASNGGDIYYMSTCGSGHVARFVLADVAGHGEVVAELSKMLRKLMRKYIGTPNQATFARVLNQKFAEMAEESRFATAVMGTYFSPTDHLMLCNAGHPAPLWYHAKEKRWQLLHQQDAASTEDIANLPFGLLKPTPYEQFVVKLELDDVLVVYTDALSEARNAAGDQLGEQGLLELVAQVPLGPPETFSRRVLDRVAEHRGGRPPEDDQTLLVIHHTGQEMHLTLGKTLRAMAKMMGFGRVYLDPADGE